MRHPFSEKQPPCPPTESNIMNTRIVLASAFAACFLTLSGCAVTRGQETVGAYVDDTAITSSIKVETLNGTVLLSGFAKNPKERGTAEAIARRVSGVREVRNEIAVRP